MRRAHTVLQRRCGLPWFDPAYIIGESKNDDIDVTYPLHHGRLHPTDAVRPHPSGRRVRPGVGRTLHRDRTAPSQVSETEGPAGKHRVIVEIGFQRRSRTIHTWATASARRDHGRRSGDMAEGEIRDPRAVEQMLVARNSVKEVGHILTDHLGELMTRDASSVSTSSPRSTYERPSKNVRTRRRPSADPAAAIFHSERPITTVSATSCTLTGVCDGLCTHSRPHRRRALHANDGPPALAPDPPEQ